MDKLDDVDFCVPTEHTRADRSLLQWAPIDVFEEYSLVLEEAGALVPVTQDCIEQMTILFL